MNSSRPTLSVIVAVVSDTMKERADVFHLAGCLQALAQQESPPPMEIIVPYHDSIDGIEDLREQFPDVTFLPVTISRSPAGSAGSREHHDVIRARGLSVARGKIVALIEDYGHAAPDWCANVVAAHDGSFASVGGAMENGIDRPLNWAVYFCDYGKYQNPLPSGEADFASDANVSYDRDMLEMIRPTWETSFREVVVNGALSERGGRLGLRSDIVVYQHRNDLRFMSALRERFIWGLSYAVTRNELLSRGQRIIYAILAPLLPLLLTLRIARTAWTRRRNFGKFVRCVHLILLLLICWCIGESLGYVTQRLGGSNNA